MAAETRQCQSCKKTFPIDPEDFDFYRKISVPPPTFCPDCRIIRRMAWRNVWHLYKKPDALTGQEIFSAFPPESPVKIYEREYWISDAWDPLTYGRDIDWSRPFFAQFYDLLTSVPLPNHSIQNAVNCEYCTNASYIKNCYYSRGLGHTEDCAYVIWDEASRQCMDSHMTDHCELSYGNVNAARCYRTFFSVNCEDCQDTVLSKDCSGCSSCFGCVGLRGKSYHIFNQPLSKEEYASRLKELDLGSWRGMNAARERAEKLWMDFPVKFMHGLQNSNVSGDYIYNSKNTHRSYRLSGAEDSKFCLNMLMGPVKDCYDYSNWGQGSELLYEALVCGDNTYNIKFSWNCYGGARNIQYSMYCWGAENIFGCVGVKKNPFCILNKQYSKEEYEKLVPRLIQHMNDMPYVDKKGRVYKYGEFFPAELSPTPYNISEAHEFFPKTEEEVLAEGWKWKKEESRNYAVTRRPEDLPDHIAGAGDDVLGEVIGCSHGGKCGQECTEAFRIVRRELEFLRQLGLPLPRLCPNCRHYERLKWRNLPQFFPRNCQCGGSGSREKGEERSGGGYKNTTTHFHGEGPCPNSFETTYAPGRPEIVYCENCYNAEVA